jgi:hypothetical protein
MDDTTTSSAAHTRRGVLYIFLGFERIGFLPDQTKRGRRHFVCFGSTGEFTGKKKDEISKQLR